ncbi:MAG: cyanophycinase, partial [Ignavibacteria bacterium]|nr:cyanophycinase [Ignavibacteria bacterium]
MKSLIIIFSLLFCSQAFGQTYTSYFTGNSTDSVAVPTGGICMMGGASEHNEAMRWFLRRASGGDILVL